MPFRGPVERGAGVAVLAWCATMAWASLCADPPAAAGDPEAAAAAFGQEARRWSQGEEAAALRLRLWAAVEASGGGVPDDVRGALERRYSAAGDRLASAWGSRGLSASREPRCRDLVRLRSEVLGRVQPERFATSATPEEASQARDLLRQAQDVAAQVVADAVRRMEERPGGHAPLAEMEELERYLTAGSGGAPVVPAERILRCGLLGSAEDLATFRENLRQAGDLAQYAAEVECLERINDLRLALGLRVLRIDPRLVRVCREHLADMKRRGFFGHVDPAGRTWSDRSRDAGYPMGNTSENLAQLAPTADAALAVWISSPAHLRTLLLGPSRDAGIAFDGEGLWGFQAGPSVVPGSGR